MELCNKELLMRLCIESPLFRGAVGVFRPPGVARGGLPFFHTRKIFYPPPPKLFGVCENILHPFPGGLLSEIPLGAPGLCVKWSFDATSYSFDATLMPLDDTVTVTVTLPHCVIGVVDEDLR